MVTEEEHRHHDGNGHDGGRPSGSTRLVCTGFEPSASLDRGSTGRAMYGAIIREMLQTMLLRLAVSVSATAAEGGLSGASASACTSDGNGTGSSHLSPLLSTLCDAVKALRPWYEFLWLVAKHTSTLPTFNNGTGAGAETASSSPPPSSSSSHVLKVISVDYTGAEIGTEVPTYTTAVPSLVCGLYTMEGHLLRMVAVKIGQVKDENESEDEEEEKKGNHMITALLFYEITNGQLLGTMRSEQYRSCFVGTWSSPTDAQSSYSSASHAYQTFVDTLAVTKVAAATAAAGGASTQQRSNDFEQSN